MLRTLLTMLGIIIGIASVIMIISLGEGATKSITEQISAFGTNTIIVFPGSDEQGQRGPQVSSNESLTLEDATAIGDKGLLQNVSLVSAIVTKPVQATANGETTNATVQGVSAAYAELQSFTLVQGNFFGDDAVEGLSRVAVLGNEIVEDLFGEGAEPVGESIKIDNRSFRVIGVLEEKDTSGFSNPNQGIYIPVTTVMKIMLGQDYVSMIMARAENAELVDQTVLDIENLMIDRHDIDTAVGEAKDFTVSSSKEALETVGSVTGLLTALLAGIAGISLVVGGIGIMNIMLVTVTERTKEIGLLKAIGARQNDILTQFLIEAVVLTLVGGTIGMLLGIGLSFIVTQFANLPFVLSARAVLLAVGVSSGVGIVFGYYPARRAARLSPIDALRYE